MISAPVKILFVDDEEDMVVNIQDYFSDYPLTAIQNSEEALEKIRNEYFDIIISDYRMPKVTGYDLLLEARNQKHYHYGILFTAFADKELLENALNHSLIHKLVEKPVKLSELKKIIDAAIEICQENEREKQKIQILEIKVKALEDEVKGPYQSIIGSDKGLKTVFEKVKKAAIHPINILITGETGTGKELIAYAIHNISPRKDNAFIKLNCAAIPESLFESELFGYVKGAFTGAMKDNPGKIELANGGTLFLDEIGEMKIDLQVKLLRVLQEKELCRVGCSKPVKVDFRLVTATNRNLAEATTANLFREDLFYRINEYPIQLPPLRERLGDLEDLITFFTRKYCTEIKRPPPQILPSLIAELKNYAWKGNVRELENAVKRALITLGDEPVLTAQHFQFLFASSEQLSYKNALAVLKKEILNQKISLKDIEKDILNLILSDHNQNALQASKHSGIPKDRFYRNTEK